MRIILRCCTVWGNFVTHGLDIEPNTDVSALNDIVSEKFDIPPKLQILRFKNDGIPTKLIPGWPLSHYGVHDKSIIFVEKYESPQEEDEFRERSCTVKGDYFAKLGLLTKVEEEDEHEENGALSRKPSVMGKNSNAWSGFGSKGATRSQQSQEGSNKNSDTLSETVLSSDGDDQYRRSDGELYKVKKRAKDKEERDRFIKEVKTNNIERVREFLNIYEGEADKEAKIKELINGKGDSGWSSLHWAAYLGYPELINELVKCGGDLNFVSEDGWTPLQLSVHKNYLEVMKAILKDTTKVEIDKLTNRMTALHIAVKNGKPEMVAFLLEKGASLTVKNEQGDLPVDLVPNEKVKKMIDYIEKRRAIEKFSPPKPPIVRGYLFKRGDYLYQMHLRYFVLNAEEGTLVRYTKKEDFPNKPLEIIPLKNIESVRRMNHGTLSDRNLHYIQLLYERRHILACHNEEIANQWVTFLLQGAIYANFLEENLQNEVKKSMVNGATGEIASYFGRITEEIELDDLPPSHNGVATKSQILAAKERPSLLDRLTSSFQINVKNINGKKAEEKKETTTTVKNLKKETSLDNKETEPEEQLPNGVFDEKVNFQSFKIISVLGSGAFGKVYKVMKKDTKQIYAMKALKKRNLIMKNQLRYAVTEANVLKSTNHPFVLGLHFAFQTPQYLYMVLDYCPGGDLSLHLANKGTFTEDETRFYLAELILAVEYLHTKNVIYRDLKPENILTTQSGHIKLADFGLSKEGVGDTDLAKSFCGSPAYLSPEMLKNRGVGKAADIYGIGTVMYEMLIGESPFFSEDIQKMYHNIRKTQLPIPKHLSEEAKDLLLKLLDKDPVQRPTLKNMRTHVFFSSIDWKKLEAKEITPPYLESLEDDDEIPVSVNSQFTDVDYTEENKFANRVKQYTFIKNPSS